MGNVGRIPASNHWHLWDDIPWRNQYNCAGLQSYTGRVINADAASYPYDDVQKLWQHL